MVKNNSKPIEIDQLQNLIGQIATVRDREAFSRLFEHYAPLLKSYSLAKEPGAYLVADELVQEVLIKVWNKAHLYDASKANPNTWIFTLARNCRIDYLRRNGRYASEVTSEEIFDQIEDEQSGPFEQTLQRKAAMQIHSELKKLPETQSQVLRKVYMEGKTQQEAAAELCLPLGTVKSRIRLALQKLEIVIRGNEK